MTEFSAYGLAPFEDGQHEEQWGAHQPYVCWSRMQSEAGQGLEAIVARKELERRAGSGIFMWGVGNAPAVAIPALSRLGIKIPVVFSIMRSRPKIVDAAPSRIVSWQRYYDASGVIRDLPENVIITSRGDSARRSKLSHYALMCSSALPLRLEYGTSFDVAAYRNVGGVGAPVGASQVTALLSRRSEPSQTSKYEVNLQAWLTESYWVRLLNPIEVPSALAARLSSVAELGISGWMSLAQDIRYQRVSTSPVNQTWRDGADFLV